MPGDGCAKQPVALGVAVCRKLGHAVFQRRGCLRRVRLRVVPEPCTSPASRTEMSSECTVNAQSPCACRTCLLLLRRRESSRASYSCVRTQHLYDVCESLLRLKPVGSVGSLGTPQLRLRRMCFAPCSAHVCCFFRASVAFALCRPLLP